MFQQLIWGRNGIRSAFPGRGEVRSLHISPTGFGEPAPEKNSDVNRAWSDEPLSLFKQGFLCPALTGEPSNHPPTHTEVLTDQK